MRQLIERVDRLQRLAVFEAAARLGSFSAAARELGMSQPAVTQHVRRLEADLAVELFHRGANRVRLSDTGGRLHEVIDEAFAGIERELGRLEQDRSVFVLAANPGVAQRWLVPHLDGLRSALGDLDPRLWLFDRNAELTAAPFDAAIHAGSGDWPGIRSRLLFPEIVVPVASPARAAEQGLEPGASPRDLLHAELLHLDDVDRPWMSWTSWFDTHGLEIRSGSARVVYNNYALVLQEAIAGNGIALGWRYMVDDLLDQGVLVAVGPEVEDPAVGWYLIWGDTGHGAAIERLWAWLSELIRA